MTKYEYTSTMKEISGFGGGYENTCRAMVVAGLEWWDANPDADPKWGEFKNIYGLTTEENEDAKTLQNVMNEAAKNDCTGAMMQATMSHVLYIHKNGWEKYVSDMTNG